MNLLLSSEFFIFGVFIVVSLFIVGGMEKEDRPNDLNVACLPFSYPAFTQNTSCLTVKALQRYGHGS